MNKSILAAITVLGIGGATAGVAITNAAAPTQVPSTVSTQAPEAKETDAPVKAPAGAISEAQAKAAAEKAVAGSKAVKSELEDENGTVQYNVTVQSAKGASEVKVDAKSGAVLKQEAAGTDGAEAAKGSEKAEKAEKPEAGEKAGAADHDNVQHESQSESDTEGNN